MTNIQDLHIEKELLPLLNFTTNEFSKNAIRDILKQPLDSVEEIFYRQTILKGFIDNNRILKDYSYSKRELLEILAFLTHANFTENPKQNLRLQLLFSEYTRLRAASKFIQVVLFLHKIHTFYISRLNLVIFPEGYKKELLKINDFLLSLNLPKYELLIREQKFKVKHIIELTKTYSKAIYSEEFESFWKSFFIFEAYLSISLGIIKQKWKFPAFSENEFTLVGFYHPMLLNPVKNSFTTSNNIVLITCPNMSGKSTFLKAVSLCVYLGHVGLPVPAENAKIPFTESISVLINLNDDIVSGFSHFMTEVINLKTVITEASTNKKCFAVFDEIFRGTNNEDAVEISTTTIKGLRKFKRSIFFISTHLHELKEIEEVKSKEIASYYIDCELNENNPKFTYQLKEGWSDIKVGRILFKNEGLNELLA